MTKNQETEMPEVEEPQVVKIVCKDEIVNGIPCVALELEASDDARELEEPTPAMWTAIYIMRQFFDGKLIKNVEEFVREGQFVFVPVEDVPEEEANNATDEGSANEG